jgi:hypothetical protein
VYDSYDGSHDMMAALLGFVKLGVPDSERLTVVMWDSWSWSWRCGGTGSAVGAAEGGTINVASKFVGVACKL